MLFVIKLDIYVCQSSRKANQLNNQHYGTDIPMILSSRDGQSANHPGGCAILYREVKSDSPVASITDQPEVRVGQGAHKPAKDSTTRLVNGPLASWTGTKVGPHIQ